MTLQGFYGATSVSADDSAKPGTVPSRLDPRDRGLIPGAAVGALTDNNRRRGHDERL
jgi:hypothetical protein